MRMTFSAADRHINAAFGPCAKVPSQSAGAFDKRYSLQAFQALDATPPCVTRHMDYVAS